MRNLQLFSCGSYHLLRGIFAIDADTGDIWLISDSLKLFCYKELGKTCKEHVNLSLEANLESSNAVISLDYVLDLESVYFALRNGDIYKFSVESDELDNIGSVACGLECAVWSPDQEIIVLVSTEGKVVMLSKNCDPISESNLLTGEFGEASPIVLGWGKRETQFKGKAGKYVDLKDKDSQESVNILTSDDRKVRICWRGDGQFFAISFVNISKGLREIKIFTRECVLHATSESVAGIGQSLSWKPSANLITTNRTSHRQEIVFFEKNGLRYGEFSLPCHVTEYFVREVEWNSNSTILLVLLEPLISDTKTLVQLWTCNNAHWYLKQEICFPSVSSPTLIRWNTIQPNTLHILTQSGSYLTYELRTVVTQSNEYDNWIAVIDGCRVLLSPFRDLTVPPPMSSCSVELSRPVIEVIFGREEYKDRILCLLSNYTIIELKHSKSDGNINNSEFLDKTGFYSLSKPFHFRDNTTDISYHTIRHIQWITVYLLLALSYSSDAKEHKIELYNILSEEREIVLVSVVTTIKPILTLISCSDSLAVEFIDGEVNRVSCTNETLSLQPWVNLLYPSHRISIARFSGEEHILGFTVNGRLFLDTIELCSNATSYYLHSHFLLITTSSHYLHSINLSTPIYELPAILPTQSHTTNDAVRRVERGAEIITAVSNDSKVVLQMPRGNLEAIHPRALILTIIAKLLDNREYSVAFAILRRQRINMNLFHDYNPEIFISSIHDFITQVHQPQFLNIFITELSDQDICTTMYPNMKRHVTNINSENKVNSVCDIMVETCEKANNTNLYLLPILTALIKRSPSQLGEVLTRIKNIPVTSKTSQEDALKYISLLIDMKQLYKVALGTYDFDIMLLVAQNSNMDPKEYLPFMNNLKSLEENYRAYFIDCHLCKYESALVHILKCRGREEECIAFINKHELYSKALEQIPTGDGELIQRVSLAYGNWLCSKEKYPEAGLVFIQIGELALALKAYRKSDNYHRVLSLALQLNLPKDSFHKIVYELVSKLKSINEIMTTSQILCEYTQDYEDAIFLLIENNIFNEAYRLIYKYLRIDLLETHFKPKLTETAQNMLSMLIESRTIVEKYVSRLEIVLTNKLEEGQTYFEEGGDIRDHEFFSEQSSVTGQSQTNSISSKGSKSSSKSARGSRSRKKQERKKYRLKEGSAHEDIALLEEIRGVVVRVDQIQDDLNIILDLLIITNQRLLARDLQTNARATITYLASIIPKTWHKHRLITISLSLVHEDGIISSPNLCTGIINVLKGGDLFPAQTDVEISEPLIRSIKWEISYLLSS
ncbi:Elongator complex protein 1 [Oopsacas minuta]|uniref:Elongator complex protein 1 n=1 Tax=Oopsacas minuta TaxID=111878 RepID=A0AAV7K1V6_9METZ|nr:Elongator complex protein 1 [Oopsacas minuta]